MNHLFTFPPERYLAESGRSSRLWTLWFPLITVVFIVAVAATRLDFYQKWLISERTGILEFSNVLLPLLTSVVALRLCFLRSIRKDRFLWLWCFAMVVGGLFLAGEEASWGQHYVGWTTPEFWSGLNDQAETNFHNISHWLDQKPRLLLTIGIIVGGLVIPALLINRPDLLPRRFDFIYPPKALSVIALLVLVGELYQHVRNLFSNNFFDTFRAGEFQEVYICWYLFYYALFLWWRANGENGYLGK